MLIFYNKVLQRDPFSPFQERTIYNSSKLENLKIKKIKLSLTLKDAMIGRVILPVPLIKIFSRMYVCFKNTIESNSWVFLGKYRGIQGQATRNFK